MLSDNCRVCGNEFLIGDFRRFASNGLVCITCLNLSDPSNDYAEVKKIIFSYLKISEQISDPELASPDIKIEPMESNIHKAVELLKRVNPGYFVGVRKIVVDTGAGYGHVSSGPGQDPSIIHINLSKIRSEIQNKLSAASKEDQEKELVRQIAITISHEKGHVASYNENTGFPGEAPATSEENSMMGKIDNYYNSLK